MSNYQRPPGSLDVKIEEIPEGVYRVKIMGTIVKVSPLSISVSDGTGTLSIQLGKLSSNEMEIKEFGRFIINVTNTGERMYANLISWRKLPREIMEKYWKLVNIERKKPQEQ